MKRLDENIMKELNQLITTEVKIINKCFFISQELGLAMLNNSINSFVDIYIKEKYGDVVLAMCSEYRVFIVGLAREIDDKYQDVVVSTLLIPRTNAFKNVEER